MIRVNTFESKSVRYVSFGVSYVVLNSLASYTNTLVMGKLVLHNQKKILFLYCQEKAPLRKGKLSYLGGMTRFFSTHKMPLRSPSGACTLDTKPKFKFLLPSPFSIKVEYVAGLQ